MVEFSRVTCTRRIQFCCGHRVHGHEGKCAYLHGHNYVAMLTAEAELDQVSQQDELGRVVDFSVLKQLVGGWVEENWDHGFVLWKEDPLRSLWYAGEPLAGHPLYVLPENPTAENMAAHLLRVVGPQALKGTGVRLVMVQLWETENCRAEVML